jgi:hypothetical protein
MLMGCGNTTPLGRKTLRMSVPRRVVVKGRQGVVATVVVTIYRGEVWLSIVPPFTWEAIMEPGKVDELIHVLGLVREEARQSMTVGITRVDRESSGVTREIRNRPGSRQVNSELDALTAAPNTPQESPWRRLRGTR